MSESAPEAPAPENNPTPGTGETEAPPNDQQSTDTPDTEDAAAVQKQRAYWQREARKKDKALAEATQALEALKEQHQSAEEKALTQARKAAKEESDKEWSAKYRTLAVRSAALSMLAGVVKAPDLALPHLDLSEIDIADDGTVDQDALKAQVEAVLEKYPILAVDADGNQPPHPHADLGPRKTPPASKSVSDQLREALRPRR